MTAEYFDGWFADIGRSPARHQLFTTYLGLPEEIGPNNLIPLNGLQEVARSLRVGAEDRLIDLACGRGGPGMWLARELGCELLGVDFSAEAVRQATDRRERFGLEASAGFVVGDLAATGLPEGHADAVVCLDAFGFAEDRDAAAGEIARIVRPGGHVVLTSWEAIDHDGAELTDRARSLDVTGSLSRAGLTDVTRTERPDWYDVERQLWDAAASLDPGDDAALASTKREAERVLPAFDRKVRVLVTAVG